MDIINELIKYGNMLIERNLTTGTGGNISMCDREKELMYITPSGVDYADIKPEDICAIDFTGKQVEGHLKPSSESNMHLQVYLNRSDVNAMIHCHAIYSTVVASTFNALPAVSYLVAHSGSNEVKVAPYRQFGTLELAEVAVDIMGEDNAVLLANHGINTVGQTLRNAFVVLEQLEFCSELYVKSRSCGDPKIITKGEMESTTKAFTTYGQK